MEKMSLIDRLIVWIGSEVVRIIVIPYVAHLDMPFLLGIQ